MPAVALEPPPPVAFDPPLCPALPPPPPLPEVLPLPATVGIWSGSSVFTSVAQALADNAAAAEATRVNSRPRLT